LQNFGLKNTIFTIAKDFHGKKNSPNSPDFKGKNKNKIARR
jgi:hypothetical protein